MKLVVGLGNPGAKYSGNRHNAGFMVIDELMHRAHASFSSKFKGEFAKTTLAGESVVLLKPMTFMNLSGESVAPCARFFDIAVEDTVVVHDELDLELGDVRVKSGGGHAGHNGLKSIFTHHGRDFSRVRFGIGRHPHMAVRDWVLTDFSSDDRIDLDQHIGSAADAVERILRGGILVAQNETNRKKKKSREAPVGDDPTT
ncbi:MAG: PTH1 family peptidyl-tRNA hydrolase [Myxococcota bacterium]|jgi:PTH1 family peptidyl-tRNA hydrolase